MPKRSKRSARIARFASLFLAGVFAVSPLVGCSCENTEDTTTGGDPSENAGGIMTNFVTSSIDIDKLLERPYEGEVPTAFSEIVFATHSKGWGFDDDTLFVTGDASGHGLPINISVDGRFIRPTSATWRASHVTSEYIYEPDSTVDAPAAGDMANLAPYAKVSASHTSSYDPDGLIHICDEIKSYSNSPRNRWSNYGGGNASDSITFEFDYSCEVSSVKVYPYDDGGATRLPAKLSVEYFADGKWQAVTNSVGGDSPKANLTEITFDPVDASKVRVVFTAQSGKAVGATEIEIFGKAEGVNADLSGITVNETKFITVDSVAACFVEVKNNGSTTRKIDVTSVPSVGDEEIEDGGFFLLSGGDKAVSKELAPGESIKFCTALSYSEEAWQNTEKIESVLGNANALADHVGSFMQWFKDNVPYFDCDDPEILQTYYFRWLTYRNHIRRISDRWDGYIISEFLPNVRWAGRYNSISCAAGHHLYEGRWIRDAKYLDSYQEFWLTSYANPRLYSFSIADAYYARYLVTGDTEELTQYLDGLVRNYSGWEGANNYTPEIGLFKQIADRDGMEYGIGGDGYRPTINSYMYGDAVAISKIARLAGNEEIAAQFEEKASTLRNLVHEKLWNEEEGFFESLNAAGKSVGVREEIGYVPWYYNLPEDDEKYASAFTQLLDPEGFAAEFGPTTAEQRDKRFMRSTASLCTWDGPSWPFATSQTLVAAANLLNNYEQNSAFSKDDWFDLIKTYAHTHYEDGYSWIAENLNPITGEWIANGARCVHYNHSTFNDNIITGLVGLRPDSEEGSLVVNPLVGEDDLSYFALENVAFRGRNITVVYDRDGSRYNAGAGLRVYVDGKLAAEADTLCETTVDLTK